MDDAILWRFHAGHDDERIARYWMVRPSTVRRWRRVGAPRYVVADVEDMLRYDASKLGSGGAER